MLQCYTYIKCKEKKEEKMKRTLSLREIAALKNVSVSLGSERFGAVRFMVSVIKSDGSCFPSSRPPSTTEDVIVLSKQSKKKKKKKNRSEVFVVGNKLQEAEE